MLLLEISNCLFFDKTLATLIRHTTLSLECTKIARIHLRNITSAKKVEIFQFPLVCWHTRKFHDTKDVFMLANCSYPDVSEVDRGHKTGEKVKVSSSEMGGILQSVHGWSRSLWSIFVS